MNAKGIALRLRKSQNGQSSLEYLLLLAAFFSAFGILLPSISFSVEQFFSASDAALAKNLAAQLQEQETLFQFLADGSKNTLKVLPSQKISISSQGSLITIFAGEKQFQVQCSSPQLIPLQEFSSKFFIQLERINGATQISVNQSKP